METKQDSPFTYEKRVTQDIYLTPAVGKHTYTLIWLHGLGDSSEGFLDFFHCKAPKLPNTETKVILLQAPTQPVSSMGGASMPSWYDMVPSGKGEETTDDEVQIAKSTKRVMQVINQEAKVLGGDYKKVFLGGFS